MDSLLNQQTASRFARIVLAGIHREYPNKLDHVMNDAGEVLAPRRLHPAFYGCFDWHSAVHGHWLLARLLRLLPNLPEAGDIRAALATSLTPGNIAVELAYLTRPNSGSFERTYGWAWLLKLHEELGRSAAAGVTGATACAEALEPLAEVFVQRYLAYLPKLDYPIRSGVHSNTAFGLAFAHDWATWAGHSRLRPLVEDRARHYYGADESCPAHMEPGGADFFSPALMEADLMRRVLPADDFARWFIAFLPGAPDALPSALFTPAWVSDRADLQIVHLDGLNLSRAWCMRAIAAALSRTAPESADKARRAAQHLVAAAQLHLDAAVPHVHSSNYSGEHWLATFAVLALAGA